MLKFYPSIRNLLIILIAIVAYGSAKASSPKSELITDNSYSKTNNTLDNEVFNIVTNQIRIFPIPATSFVNVTIPKFKEYTTIQIIDLAGNVVAVKNSITNQITQFNIENLKPGFYMIKSYNSNGTTKLSKLIKQ